MAIDPVNSYLGEMQGFPRESFKLFSRQAKIQNSGFTGVRKVRCNWEDRYEWTDWFFGTPGANNYPYLVNNGSSITTAITQIDIEPDISTRLTHGTTHQSQAVYIKAILTLTYEKCYVDGSDVLIENILPYTSETMVSGDFKFADDTEIKSIPLRTSGFELSIEFPRLYSVPSTIITLQKTVNAQPFTPRLYPGLTCPPGTLLCDSAYVRGGVSSLSVINLNDTFSAGFKLLYRPINWNMEFNSTTNTFEPVYDADGNVINRYPDGDFSQI